MGIVITIVVVGVSLAITGFTLFFVFKMLKGLHSAAKQEQQLLASGAPAQGQIVAVQQTGTYVNHQPQVQIVVMVTPPGGQPYQAQLLKILSMIEIPQYQPGAQVQIRYDPTNPSRIAIVPPGMAMQGMGGMGWT
ncbi:MAG: hypothetical protein JRI23_29850 [Deltaproteobacteria bacterium]|nr:hypothetical protein [Deltaproteobacteria bacterium]